MPPIASVDRPAAVSSALAQPSLPVASQTAYAVYAALAASDAVSKAAPAPGRLAGMPWAWAEGIAVVTTAMAARCAARGRYLTLADAREFVAPVAVTPPLASAVTPRVAASTPRVAQSPPARAA